MTDQTQPRCTRCGTPLPSAGNDAMCTQCEQRVTAELRAKCDALCEPICELEDEITVRRRIDRGPFSAFVHYRNPVDGGTHWCDGATEREALAGLLKILEDHARIYVAEQDERCGKLRKLLTG